MADRHECLRYHERMMTLFIIFDFEISLFSLFYDTYLKMLDLRHFKMASWMDNAHKCSVSNNKSFSLFDHFFLDSFCQNFMNSHKKQPPTELVTGLDKSVFRSILK